MRVMGRGRLLWNWATRTLWTVERGSSIGQTSDLAARSVSKRSTTSRGGFSRAKTWVTAGPVRLARTATLSAPAVVSIRLRRISLLALASSSAWVAASMG